MTVETIAAEIASLLRAALPNADVYPAESGGARDLLVPLARPTAVVTLQKIEAFPTALGDCLGARTVGRQADVTVGIALYADSEAACGALFAAVGQALLFTDTPSIYEFSCSAAEYRMSVESWRLAAQTRFPILLTHDEPAESVRSFRLHISDPKGATS